MIFGRGKKAIGRILVVEDEPLVAFDTEHFLTQAGYVVVGTVESHDAAIALIAAGGIDLVIADVNLSGPKDGVEVARVAHAQEIAVLFVTGACPLDAQHLAYGCLAKPYSQRDLLSAIQAVDMVIRGGKLPRLPAGLTLFPRPAQGDGL